MWNSLVFSLFAVAALVPAALLPLRQGAARDGAFWSAVVLALIPAAVLASGLVGAAWSTGLSLTLWVSVSVTLGLFAVVAFIGHHAWRLAPLLMPYLALLALFAVLARDEMPRTLAATAPVLWVDLHIAVAVLAYALVTLAAMAALATVLQEGALKRKRPTRLTRMLPSVADAERLSGRLLAVTEAVLGIGVVSGLALRSLEGAALFHLDHKSLLSILAFAVIGALLLGHRVCGVRGRLAARVMLVAYLLLTLAYPGVKFVTQVLISAS